MFFYVFYSKTNVFIIYGTQVNRVLEKPSGQLATTITFD